jgi:hypothetical protein
MPPVVALLAGVLMLISVVPAEATQTRAVPPSGLRLVMLVGQSNMFGTAPLEAPSRPLDTRVWSLDPVWGWREARDPLHGWINPDPRTGGVGPGMAFARAVLARDPSLRIGLIPCAHSGRIRDWQRTAAPAAGRPVSNYQQCLRLMQQAQAYGQPSGILVYHGEADAGIPNLPGYQEPAGESWGHYYEQLIADMRADLATPDLPAVHAQLATVDAPPDLYPDWDAVKASQSAVRLPHTAMVRTEDLRPSLDGLHHTTASHQIIGARLADAWWELRPDFACATGHRVVIRQTPGPPVVVVDVAARSPIQALPFGQIRNATVTAPSIRGHTATFTVRRTAPGRWLVPFTVVDGCGPWPSFIGGGT